MTSNIMPSMDLNSSNHQGNQSYFTPEERVILTATLSLMGFLGILCNGIVIYAIISLGSYVDVPANMFILSQAFADLGITASIPIYISHLYFDHWDVVFLYTGFFLFASLGSLFLLTLNRLLSVVDSLKYVRRMTPFRAKALVTTVWMAALLITLLHTIGHLNDSENFFNYGRYYIIVLVTSVLLFNAYMFHVSRNQARKMRRQKTALRVMTGLQKNLREDFRSVRTLSLIGGTFLLSSFPLTLANFLYGNDKKGPQYQRLAAFFGPLMVLNSVLDPLIYYLRSSEFRSFYQRMKRLHRLPTRPNSQALLTVFTPSRIQASLGHR